MTIQEKKNELLTEKGIGRQYITGYVAGAEWMRIQIRNLVSSRQLRFEIAESTVADQYAEEDFSILRIIDGLEK